MTQSDKGHSSNAELADEIERTRRESGGRNHFALWLLTNVDEIIAALRQPSDKPLDKKEKV